MTKYCCHGAYRPDCRICQPPLRKILPIHPIKRPIGLFGAEEVSYTEQAVQAGNAAKWILVGFGLMVAIRYMGKGYSEAKKGYHELKAGAKAAHGAVKGAVEGAKSAYKSVRGNPESSAPSLGTVLAGGAAVALTAAVLLPKVEENAGALEARPGEKTSSELLNELVGQEIIPTQVSAPAPPLPGSNIPSMATARAMTPEELAQFRYAQKVFGDANKYYAYVEQSKREGAARQAQNDRLAEYRKWAATTGARNLQAQSGGGNGGIKIDPVFLRRQAGR